MKTARFIAIVGTTTLILAAHSRGCVTPPSGLISWWPGESNANDVVGGNNGIAAADVGFIEGKVNQSFQFSPGNNAGVTVPASASLNVGVGAGFSLEGWIRPASATSQQPLVEWAYDGVETGAHLWISASSFTLPAGQGGPGSLFVNLVETNNASHRFASAPGIIDTNSLQHIALTYDKASGMAKLYRNSLEVAVANLGSFTPKTTTDLLLGRRIDASSGTQFTGTLDEMSLYNRALTSNEIAAIFSADNAGKCASVPPIIAQQPTNQTVVAGNSVTFGVTATGTSPLNYQWIFNATPGLHTNILATVFSNSFEGLPPTFDIPQGTSFLGWHVDAGNVDIVSGLVTAGFSGPSHTGTNAMDINGGMSGTISTDLVTQSNRTYLLSFAYTKNPGGLNNYTPTAVIKIGGAPVLNLAVDSSNSISQLNWQTTSLVFQASQPLTKLELVSTYSGNRGIFFDTIRVDEVQLTSSPWQGTIIPNATNSILTLANVHPTNTGNYSVIVSNVVGPVFSSNALLTVLPPPDISNVPVIYSFAPIKANVGETVTLSGTNFSPVAASNIVYFGAVRALVTQASPTSLTAVVPSGATHAAPSVTVAGLTGQASSYFLPTFAGGGAGLDASSFAAKFDLSASSDQIAVSIADMDGDGKPDVVVANAHGNTVGVYRNIGTDGSLTGSAFAPRVDFPGGSPVYGSTIADLDGDGRLDIILANNGNESGTTISVLRNTSAPGEINSNSFGAKLDFTVGSGPIRVSAGDLDGDGRLDVVVGTASGLSVLRNTSVLGSVSFAPYFQLVTGPNTWDAETADVDGDGRRDLAAVNYDSGTVSLLRNTATPGTLSAGSFAAKVDIASGTSHDVAIGDLDGDGRVDLVVPRFNNGNVAVYRNVGAPGSITSNSFAAGVLFVTGSGPSGVTIGDVDGDGKPDLAVTGYAVNQLSVLRNTSVPGSITAGSFAARVDYVTGANPHQVALGDLNGDGRPDAVVTSWGSSSIAVLKNAAIPTPPFITQHPTNRTVIAGAPVTFTSAATGSSTLAYQWRWNGTNIDNATNATYSIASAQAGLAGLYSVRVTNLFGAVESSNALLTVLPPPPVPVIYSFAPAKARGGETVVLSGTNFSDVAASNIVYFGAVRAVVTQASPTSLTVTVPAGATYAPPSVAVGGLMGYASSAFLPTYPGGGAPIDATTFAAKFDLPANTIQAGIAIGDLDGDGYPDIVVANATGSSLSVYRNLGLAGPLTNASFAPRVNFALGTFPYSTIVADIDGDGRLDIVASNNGNGSGNTVSVLRNLASPGSITSGSFAARVNFTTGAGPVRVAAGDLDKDGRTDLVVATFQGGGVSVLRNIGQSGVINAGTFAPKVDFSTGAGVWEVQVGDIDMDGKSDIVAANYTAKNVSILRNQSSPGSLTTNSFAPKVNFATGDSYSVAIGDLNGDGKSDLVVANFTSNNISVFRNTSSPGGFASNSLAPPVLFATGSGPHGVAIGDVDGDGQPDLALSDFNLSKASVLKNNTSLGANINSNSFAAKVDFTCSVNPQMVMLADLNGDGRPELLTTSWAGSSLSILQNNTAPPAPPLFVTQPVSHSVVLGDQVVFTASATGAQAYQWQFNGDNLPGQTNSSLLLPDAQLDQAGSYTVVATNLYGPAMSTVAVLAITIPSCVTPPAGLVAWWSGNGDALDSVNINHGVTQSGVGFAVGKAGQAFLLGVTNNGVRIPASAALNVGTGNGMTVECWVNLATVAGNNPLIEWNDGDEATGGYWGVHLFAGTYGAGSLYANIVGPGESWHQLNTAAGVLKSNAFQHVALTYDKASGVARIYCNGVVVAQRSIGSFTPTTDTDLYLGKRPAGTMIANSIGLMDEVSLYNRALNTDEIAAIYAARGAGKCPLSPTIVQQPIGQTVAVGDPVALAVTATGALPLSYQWQLAGSAINGATNRLLAIQEAQIGQAGDYSVTVSNSHGTAQSSNATLTVITPQCTPTADGLVAWWPGDGNARDSLNTNHGVAQSGISFAAGRAGQAFQLGVTNNGVRIPASSALDVGTGDGMTIECWINLATVTGNCPLVEWNDGVPGGAFFGTHLYVGPYGAGSLYANLVGAGEVYHQLHSAAGVVKSNVFQHIALTYDRASGITRLFCNGAIVAEQNLGAFTHLTGNDLYLGKRPAGDVVVNSTGLMDEVSLYNRALTTNEIAAIYAARGTGKCPLPPIVLNVTPPSWFVNEGQTVSFTALAVGSSPLSFQWQLDGTDVADATSPLLVLSNVVYAQAGNYSVIVSNAGGTTTSSNVVLRINRAPLADASATDLLVIAPPQCDALTNTAVVVLDGSRASDLDGDALSYAWFSAGDINAFATGVVAVTTLPIGTNQLTLTVSDGLAANSQSFAIEVISTSQAVDRLAALVQADVPKANALLASLRAALASIDRCQPATAINQLEAFKNKVLAQIAPSDPALANQLLADAQAIIDALNGGTSPVLATLEITSINRGDNGKSHLRIKGAAGRVHIVETSTDMVNWVKVGVAGCCGGADYQFDDAQTPSTGMRFYRVVSPK